MAFSSQAFTAPSITKKPKLGIKTISSSVFRSAAKSVGSTSIKIPKGMGYGRRVSKVDPTNLQSQSTPIEQTLVETNKILVEIQNQLSIDFSYRIAKEKEDIKRIKKLSESEKRGRAESKSESASKFGFINKITSTITNPVTNIFSRIANFFVALATGFVINKAVKWLSNEENSKKVQSVFNFIGEHWKPILLTLGGLYLANVAIKVYRLYRLLRSGLRLLGIGKSVGTRGVSGLSNNAARNIDPRKLGRVNASYDRFIAGKSNIGDRLRLLSNKRIGAGRLFTKGGFDASGKLAGKNILSSSLGKMGGPISKLLRPVFKRIPIIGGLIDFAVSMALGEPLGRAAAKSVGAMLGTALGSFPPLIPFGGPIWGGILGDILAGTIYDAITKKEPANDDMPKMIRGGIIPGPLHVNKDITPILGRPGERVVPYDEERKNLLPFVDDVIYDGGKLIRLMLSALKKQEKNNEKFVEINEEFSKAIKGMEDFSRKEFIKKHEPNLFQKLFGLGGASPSSRQQSVKSPALKSRVVPKVSIEKPVSKKSSGMNIIPIDLGTIQKQPKSITPQRNSSGGDSLPIIDPVGTPTNEMIFVMQELGILMG